jgi:hypothetical protein
MNTSKTYGSLAEVTDRGEMRMKREKMAVEPEVWYGMGMQCRSAAQVRSIRQTRNNPSYNPHVNIGNEECMGWLFCTARFGGIVMYPARDACDPALMDNDRLTDTRPYSTGTGRCYMWFSINY